MTAHAAEHAAETPLCLILALGILAFIASWCLTKFIRRHAIANAILDVPNERSSHSAPTPRGGGAAIVAVVLSAIAALGLLRVVPVRVSSGLLYGGALVGFIGWLDDRRGVRPLIRASIHGCAAAFVVLSIGGFREIAWGGSSIRLGIAGSILAIVTIVWATNLYNFMDGIDGLASVEAITAGGAGGAMLMLGGARGLATISFVVAGAAAGFLIWNWMPARIFLGDVGSGFLGFMFGSLAIISDTAGAVRWYFWLLLLLVFAADSTLTLLRRAAHGDAWYTPHRLHAYQRLVKSGCSHARVALLVGGLNLVLAGFAMAAFLWRGALWPSLGASVIAVFGAYAAVERRIRMWQPDHPISAAGDR